MGTYTLVANNKQGASVEFGGDSMSECKKAFAVKYEIKDFEARIYDNECNGAFVQFKPMGNKTYQNPK